MDKFEKKLRLRIWICRVMIVVLLVVMVAIGEAPDGMLLDSGSMDAAAQSVSRILFFGTLVALIVCIRRTKSLLACRLDRRAKQIAEEDERRIAILQQSGAAAMDVLLVLLMAAVFALAFIDMTAFHTAYAVLLTAVVLRFGLMWYFSKQI